MNQPTHNAWHHRIGSRLSIASALLLLGSLLALNFISSYIIKDYADKQGERAVNEQGEALVSKLHEHILSTEQLATAIAQLHLIKDPQLLDRMLHEQLKNAVNSDLIAGGGLWPEPNSYIKDKVRSSFFYGKDKNDKLIAIQDYNDPNGPGYHNEEWYVPAQFMGRHAYWSRSYVDPYSKEPMITCTIPYYGENKKFLGVSTVDLRLSGIRHLLESIDPNSHSYLFLVDRHNTFISFPAFSSQIRVDPQRHPNRYAHIHELTQNVPLFMPIARELAEHNHERRNQLTNNERDIAMQISNMSYQIHPDEAALIVSDYAKFMTSKQVIDKSQPNYFLNSQSIIDDPIFREQSQISYFQIPGCNWRVAISRPHSAVNADVQLMVTRVSLALAALFILVLLGNFIFVQQTLVNPITLMTKRLRNAEDEDQLLHDPKLTSRKDELGQLASWSNRRTENLLRTKRLASSATAAKNEFLANMSHEIRTPLNGIIGILDIIGNQDHSTELRDHLRTIRSSSEALLVIINDILDLSKIEAGKLTIEPVDVRIRTLVEDAAELLGPQAYSKELECTTFTMPDVPEIVHLDPVRLRQILVNLISNAIKFTDSGTVAIDVSCSSRKGNQAILNFCVADSGQGMSRENIHRVFAPFVQADGTSTRRHGGTGLGLSICKRLIELMGGTITITSNEGSGTEVRFTIPAQVAPTPEKLTNNDLHDASALILDNNETAGFILSRYCAQWGIDVSIVDTIRECTLHLRKHGAPTFLIIDEATVQGHRSTLIHDITRQPHIHDSKLIFLSGHSSSNLHSQLKREGFDAILTKPLRESVFKNTLSHLRSDHDSKPAIITEYYIKNEREKLNLRILLVEDNMINAKVAKSLLENDGCTIFHAEHGGEAIELLEKEEIDLVLMDIQMPVMDGYETTRHIRRSNRIYQDIPIIALTANSLASDRKQCFDVGMNDFISKPFKKAILFKVLEEWKNKDR